jgi:hypothetical protein
MESGDLKIGEIRMLMGIIEKASKSGTFEGKELTSVGYIFERLTKIAERIKEDKPTAERIKEDKPTTQESENSN